MKNQKIHILAIESSCDETAAAVIGEENNQPVILSNIISSQVDSHAKTGGVVPEVASRAHLESIVPVISQALILAKRAVIPAKAGIQENVCIDSTSQATDRNDTGIDYQEAIKLLDNVTHIAVTAGPGLIGSLLVGFNAAKTLAYAKNLPIIPIHHIEGHIYSAFAGCLDKSKHNFPVLALIASGGHTSIILMKDHGKYEILGETIDDAAGEAYDKVAKLLDLGYPGGPILSKLADKYRAEGKKEMINFPRPILRDGSFNFSFSGLKTAVLVYVKKRLEAGDKIDKEMVACSFEEAVSDVLVAKVKNAVKKLCPKTVVFAGGVSANGYLGERLKMGVSEINDKIEFLIPPKNLSGDNAVMIGLAAYYHLQKGDLSLWRDIIVDSNAELV